MESNLVKWVENKLLGDKNNYYEITNCPACNFESKLHFTVSKFQYYFCNNCKTVFGKQRPTILGVDILYNSIIQDYWRKHEITLFFGKSKQKYSMSNKNLGILHNQLFSFLNKKPNLLDYASGLGTTANYYYETKRFTNVYVYEINKFSLEFINQNFPKLKIYNEKDTFDVVILYATLEHLSNPFEMLLEINKILKPGGLIQIFVPTMGIITRNFFPDLYDQFGPGYHLNFFTKLGLQKLGDRLNFDIVSVKYLGKDLTYEYLLNFIYSKKGYRTYKLEYDNINNLEKVVLGYIINNKFTNCYGNYFIRTISKILIKAKLGRAITFLDKGPYMSIIYKKKDSVK